MSDYFYETAGLVDDSYSKTVKFDENKLRTMNVKDILNIDIEDVGLSRNTIRFFLRESVYTIGDYIKRLGDFGSRYQMIDSVLDDSDFKKNEYKNWELMHADIEMMLKLFGVGFWKKAKEESYIEFPVDYFTLIFVPFDKLGIEPEYVSTLRRAGYIKLADIIDEDSGEISLKTIREVVSSVLQSLTDCGYISKEFADLIKFKNNSFMNPDKRKCKKYRQALAKISFYNHLEFVDFKCPEVYCSGRCELIDNKIKAMVREIREFECFDQNLTIRNISLDNLIHFFSDIKRLEER